MIWSKELIKIRSSHWKSSVKKEFLNISQDSQKNRKTQCQGLFLNKVAGFWHGCFPLDFVEFLRTSFLHSTSGQLLLQDLNKPDKKLEHAQTKYYNDAMVHTQQFINSYENPSENIDYDPNMHTRYDENMQIL